MRERGKKKVYGCAVVCGCKAEREREWVRHGENVCENVFAPNLIGLFFIATAANAPDLKHDPSDTM